MNENINDKSALILKAVGLILTILMFTYVLDSLLVFLKVIFTGNFEPNGNGKFLGILKGIILPVVVMVVMFKSRSSLKPLIIYTASMFLGMNISLFFVEWGFEKHSGSILLKGALILVSLLVIVLTRYLLSEHFQKYSKAKIMS